MTDGVPQLGSLLTNYALDLQIAQFHRLLESTGAERVEDLDIPATVLQGVVSPSSWKEEQSPRF